MTTALISLPLRALRWSVAVAGSLLGRGQGRAVPPRATIDPVITTGVIVGVAETTAPCPPDDVSARAGPTGSPTPAMGLVEQRQEVQIHDHGTGEGPALLAAMLRPDRVDDLLVADPRLGPVPVMAEAMKVVLRPHPDTRGMVEVSYTSLDGAGSPDPAASHWPTAGAADRLLGRITRRRLDEERVRPRLHGGAVADPAGRAVVVLGRSGAGKSTLIAHLAHAGLSLVNDEQLTIYREHGVVGGFTRPVAIKPRGTRHLPATMGEMTELGHTELVSAERLGTRHRLTAVPAVILLPERIDKAAGDPIDEANDERPPLEDDTGSAVEIEVVAPAAAIDALAKNNLDMANRPGEALEAFAWLVSHVPVVRIRYQHTVDGAAAAVALLSDPPSTEPIPWSVHRGADPGEGLSDAYVVTSDVWWVSIGDDVVLYHDTARGMAVLNGTGARIWHTLPLASSDLVLGPEGDTAADPSHGRGMDEVAWAEVETFLVELVDHGFVLGPATDQRGS